MLEAEGSSCGGQEGTTWLSRLSGTGLRFGRSAEALGWDTETVTGRVWGENSSYAFVMSVALWIVP